MSKQSLHKFLLKNSRILILIVLLVFFSVTTDTFWGLNNWKNIGNIILYQVPVLMMLGTAMTLVIILGGIDLSIGSALSLSTCIAALVMRATQNVMAGILVGVAVGLLIGLVNGFLVAFVKVSPYIATFSMQWIAKGIAFVFMGGTSVYEFPPSFKQTFQSTPINYLIIALVLVVVVAFLMGNTAYGRQIYMIGNNTNASRISGVKTRLITLTVFAIVGVIVAITGIMYLSFLGGAEAIIGDGFPLKAIAATLVGGTAFGGGKGKVSNAIVGSMIMLVLTNGILHLGVPSVWQDLVIGVAILLSVMLERGLGKIRQD